MTKQHVWFHDWDGAEGRVSVEAFLLAFTGLDLPTKLTVVGDVLLEAERRRRPDNSVPSDGLWSPSTAAIYARYWQREADEIEAQEREAKDLAVKILSVTHPDWTWDLLTDGGKESRMKLAKELLASYDITPKEAE